MNWQFISSKGETIHLTSGKYYFCITGGLIADFDKEFSVEVFRENSNVPIALVDEQKKPGLKNGHRMVKLFSFRIESAMNCRFEISNSERISMKWSTMWSTNLFVKPKTMKFMIYKARK